MRIYRNWVRSDVRALSKLLERRRISFPHEVLRKTSAIAKRILRGGDRALLAAVARYDRVRIARRALKAGPDDMKRAWRSLSPAAQRALRQAWRNILAFHRPQRYRGYSIKAAHGRLTHVAAPLKRVGINVSAGEAPLVSTLLMCAGAARAAGVAELAIMSPPRPDGRISPPVLAAAHLAGVKEAYAMGGAHGVAALVYGTETVRPVDKVVGPGGVYSQAAKLVVQGGGGLEGPSEIAVLADASASPADVAAELVAQAEHAGENWSILVTPSRRLLDASLRETERQIRTLPRAGRARASLRRFGAAILVRSVREGLEVAERIAPEHLAIMTRGAAGIAGKVRRAGTVLVGGCSPAAAADYGAGPNHVLPTGGTARYASGLGVKDFMKHLNVTGLSAGGLKRLGPVLAVIARLEGLEGHARSLERNRG